MTSVYYGTENPEPGRSEQLAQWEEELLLGGVMLSEWTTFLACDAQTAFQAGADLAALLAAMAAIEAHLRHEYPSDGHGDGLARLIEQSPLTADLKRRLHELRRYRNRWVHVNDPDNDERLLQDPAGARNELSLMATVAMRLLLEIIYIEQWT